MCSLAAIALSSCEASDNGDLDGMWYLTAVDSLQAASDVHVSMKGKSHTWAFQADLVQFFNYDEDHWDGDILMGRFDCGGGQLIIRDPFIYDRMDGDRFLTLDTLPYLSAHGINSLPDTFAIERLDRRHLRISDHLVRLHFDKY